MPWYMAHAWKGVVGSPNTVAHLLFHPWSGQSKRDLPIGPLEMKQKSRTATAKIPDWAWERDSVLNPAVMERI